jgi:Na+-transporting NADH:ubiquinone oxidoreductase subunit NqrC
MKATQFWILLACSLIISLLLGSQIYLTRELYQQERVLGDNQEDAAVAPVYEKAWKNLAIRIYEAGRSDPALLDVLKSESIGIQPSSMQPPGTPGQTPATNAPGAVAPHPSGTTTP